MSTSDSSVLDRYDEGPVDRAFPASTESVRQARRVLRQWLDGQGLDGERADDLLVVASEMASNAVRAGAGQFRLRAWREDGGVVLEVGDDGPGFDGGLPAPDDLPSLEAEDGRGLYLVQALAERCTIVTNDGGTIVRCRVSV